MSRAVCELRYENAYLIYDLTGHIFHELKDSFTELSVVNAAPDQSSFSSEEGSLILTLNSSRFVSEYPESTLEKFAAHAQRFFEVLCDQLDLKVFTRIGLRVIWKRNFKSHDESKRALAFMKLNSLGPDARFGVPGEPEEVLFRWEGTQSGAMLRLKAETGKIDVVLPPELEDPNPKIHKAINGLTLDVDYYTVAPVERSQWNASAWIPQSVRIIKKEADAVVSRGSS